MVRKMLCGKPHNETHSKVTTWPKFLASLANRETFPPHFQLWTTGAAAIPALWAGARLDGYRDSYAYLACCVSLSPSRSWSPGSPSRAGTCPEWRRATLLALKDSGELRVPWLPSDARKRLGFRASTCHEVSRRVGNKLYLQLTVWKFSRVSSASALRKIGVFNDFEMGGFEVFLTTWPLEREGHGYMRKDINPAS